MTTAAVCAGRRRGKEASSAVARMLALAIISAPALAVGDDWPENWDDELDLAARIAAVNDGELEFITPSDAEGAHAHRNRIRVTELSLQEGWVALEQCHESLDAVPAAQILFRADGVRNLAIEEQRNIGRAWVEDHSVQLEDVGDDAMLCIRAETRAFHALGDGIYRLRNGPYMRRFLDGYYPMRVALSIEYPVDRLRLIGQSPASQPGFVVGGAGGDLSVEATFEGRLITCFDFCARDVGDCTNMTPACGSGYAMP